MEVTPLGTALVLGGAIVLYAFVAFRQWRSRILALGTLLPLAAVASTLVWTGKRDREEATDVDSKTTAFGDGQHAAGQSHATGAGPVGGAPVGGGAHGGAAATGAALADTVIARVADVAGITLNGAPERYTTATLWNRIDGGAELYTKNGLVRAAMVTAVSKAAGAGGEPTEFEVQVFEMADDARADGLWDKVEREASAPAFTAGRRAVTWRGGGEVLVGPVYARVVVSSAEPSEADDGIAKAILVALGQGTAAATPAAAAAAPAVAEVAPAVPDAALPVAPTASATPTASAEGVPARVEPPPASTPIPPSEATGRLADFGAPAHFELVFGPARTRRTADGVTIATFPSTLHAAAFLQATRPGGATRVGPMGWTFSRSDGPSPVVAALADSTALLAAGGDAETLVEAERARIGEATLPALAAFPIDADVELRVGEWGGRPALGLVAVQRLPDGAELVAAAPKKVEAGWKALQVGLSDVSASGEALAGTDPFQGPLVARLAGKMILIVAGHTDAQAAERVLGEAVARLSSASP